MPLAHILGFPRIGARRELKFALEAFWRGEITASQLQATGRELRARHWQLQHRAGLDYVAVGDFAWYDQVLNTIALLGCPPPRFGFDPAALTLEQYFALARGNQDHFAMEMTKWFDTNYHYLVPEFSASSCFDGGVEWLFDEIAEAQAAGYPVKPVLLGPLSLLHLAKMKDRSDKLALLPRLVAAYQRILRRLKEMNVEWVQIDEPVLGLDLDERWLQALSAIYSQLQPDAPKLLLATYFESVAAHATLLKSLTVAGLHVDLARAPEQLTEFLRDYPEDKVLSAGIVDGRNIWRLDLDSALAMLSPAYESLGERLWLASSCSLLHVPVDLLMETKLEPELREWLAFAVQKVAELVSLKRALVDGAETIAPALTASRTARQQRRTSSRVRNEVVRRRVEALAPQDSERAGDFSTRIVKQKARLNLPLLPTTTIGSFPQTEAIRKTRAAFKQKQISHLKYLESMRSEIRFAIEKQEAYGLDVLVHGEPERNDMVEYFAAQLYGYAFTENGWVQSYGSRCVKPPLIYGDVYRPEPMTVDWSVYAQSLTQQPVKGMLTGPVTMLQWSFVRDDQPREATALQIALALRDEVGDLEKAGIVIIQIDEPAFREGLPLKKRDWQHYLAWATRAFRLTAAAVDDATQIHTHMCYAEFNDILPAIAALDADVITIETSRSDMELLDGFGEFRYPNEIGPGVYDIHSPRGPQVAEMVRLIDKARGVIPVERLWVNPDCGLKTRSWAETDAALYNMVEAAKIVRQAL